MVIYLARLTWCVVLTVRGSAVMYDHRSPEKRFDCVDLDPYGSAVPFLDAAIGSVADGGERIMSYSVTSS